MLNQESFSSDLNNIIKVLKVTPNGTQVLKGSHRYNQTYITDIDYTEYIAPTGTFHTQMYDMICNLPRGILWFMGLSVGRDPDFIQRKEWFDIDNKVIYTEPLRDWLVHFTTLEYSLEFPDFILNNVNNPNPSFQWACQVDEFIEHHARIRWTLNDIQKGYYVVPSGVECLMFDELCRDDSPVMRFIFKWNVELVWIDYGFILKTDCRHIPTLPYRFITQKWYPILKTFRHYVEHKHIGKYIQIVALFEELHSVSYQIKICLRTTDMVTLCNVVKQFKMKYNYLNVPIKHLKHRLTWVQEELDRIAKRVIPHLIQYISVEKLDEWDRMMSWVKNDSYDVDTEE